MKTVISEKGQVTIPKALRDRLGLMPGVVVVFEAEGANLVGHKVVASEPVSKWRGRGKLPKGACVDKYLERVRG